jgi:hypothetical protein
MKFIFSSKGIVLISFLLMISLLSVMLGVISESSKKTPLGTITAENYVPERQTLYALETQNEFKIGIKEFILDFLGLKDPSLISSAGAEKLLNCFRRAGISGEKALSFSNFLRNIVDPDEVLDLQNADNKEDLKGIFALLAFFSDVETRIDEQSGQELKVLIFNPEKYIMNIFDTNIYSAGFISITNNTMLTYDEIAKIIFEVFFSESLSTETSIEREDFVAIFQTYIYLGSLLSDFKQNGGTMTQARLISELIFQSGTELKEIIDENGIEELMNFIGFASPFPSLADDPKFLELVEGTDWIEAIEKLDEIRSVVQDNQNTARFMITLAVNSMIGIENMAFESLARAQAEETENPQIYLYLSMISFSRTLKQALNIAYQDNLLIKNNEDLANNLALLLTRARGIDQPFGSEEEANIYEVNAFNELLLFLDTVEDVFSDFSGVSSIEMINDLSQENVLILENYYSVFIDYDDKFTDSFNSVISTIFVNSALNLYLQAYELMVGIEE